MSKRHLNKLDLPQNVYFVGIGGVSMSGIAQHLCTLGYNISGSDRSQNEYTAKLKNLGVQIHQENASVANCGLVVRTSAVKDNHPQIVEAKKLGIPIVLREELLGKIFDGYSTRIAICGTHGKTTVTAMVHHVLERCEVDHTAFIGGSYLGQNYFGGGDIVLAEACEYNASFLHLHPTHTLCLNIEYDHPDCYQSLADVQHTFCKLFLQSQMVILPSKLQKLCENSICYDNFVAKNLFETSHATTFDLYRQNIFIGNVRLPLVGAHNVTNTLAVACLCDELNLPLLQVCHALGGFGGVTRRWTEIKYKCRVVCDYAHHPTEIQATIATAKAITKGKVVCIFQPHTYTRTKAFWREFAGCFGGTTVVYLPIYSAREMPIDGVASQNLSDFAKSVGVDAHYRQTFADAKQFVENTVNDDDTILILGAGDIVEMAKMFE